MQLELSTPAEEQRIYTVTELTGELKKILERNFSHVWVAGEISNFHPHSSGHYYFSLKDERAHLGAAMFRGANRQLKFKLEDGLAVLCLGRISLYEPQGKYQLVVESIEPQGLGALQLAFEQLKTKLAAAGLFAAERKRPLPKFPKHIGVVTSPTGAVIRDIINVLSRRDPRIHLFLVPVNVQGEKAAPEIAAAIDLINEHGLAEVMIVGRGGGSLEDLWAFNTEMVAQAIARSKIPVVSAVGHETDFTIADFVADLRAPTPSAAAELVSPNLVELRLQAKAIENRLLRGVEAWLHWNREKVAHLVQRLKHPARRLEELNLRVDEWTARLQRAMEHFLKTHQQHLRSLSEQIHLVSPLAVLQRGYSLTYRYLEDGSKILVKDAASVKVGDGLQILLGEGEIRAVVKPG